MKLKDATPFASVVATAKSGVTTKSPADRGAAGAPLPPPPLPLAVFASAAALLAPAPPPAAAEADTSRAATAVAIGAGIPSPRAISRREVARTAEGHTSWCSEAVRLAEGAALSFWSAPREAAGLLQDHTVACACACACACAMCHNNPQLAAATPARTHALCFILGVSFMPIRRSSPPAAADSMARALPVETTQ